MAALEFPSKGEDLVPQTNDAALAVTAAEFRDELDRLREQTQARAHSEHKIIGVSAVLTGGMSAGYVLWLLRGGVLLSSLLTSLPAWRIVDPLLVLAKRDRREEEDEESLETLVEQQPQPKRDEGSARVEAPDAKDVKPDPGDREQRTT